MKRAFASVAGLVGLAALGRWLAKHRQSADSVAPSPVAFPTDLAPAEVESTDSVPVDPAADPADELRLKLAEARETEPEPAAAEQAEETLDERRARVHAKTRQAIDSMGSDSGDEGGTSS